MKIDNVKYLVLSLVVLAGLPMFTFAAGGIVQVNHSVANIQGMGSSTPTDMSSKIIYSGSLEQSQKGNMVLYDLSSNTNPTTYEVKGVLSPYYEYTLAGSCSGTIYNDQVKQCFIQWSDTGPTEVPQVPEALVLPVVAPVISSLATPSIQEDQTVNEEVLKSLMVQIIELLKQLIELKLNSR